MESITLQETESSPAEQPQQNKSKRKKMHDVTLSDAETLTSDEGDLREEELEGLDVPLVEDVLEDYVFSEDDEMHSVQRQKQDSQEKPLSKQQRRKEKRKALGQKKKKASREHLTH